MSIDIYVKKNLIEIKSHGNEDEIHAVMKIDPLAPQQEYYMDLKETFIFYGLEYRKAECVRIFAEDPGDAAIVRIAMRDLTGIDPVLCEGE